LSRATRPEIEKLAEMLANQNVRFPGIVGPSDVASSFAAVWTEMTGQKAVEFMDQIIYSLTKVLFPPEVEGSFRFAKKEEAKIIADWMQAFAKSSLPKAEQLDDAAALARAEGMIAEGRVAVWDVKGKPVAQAAVTGTSDVSRIQAVYTPAEHRGQGYASAVVAHLSQHQLENGKKMCCLYADARNPVSNSIYRKIGYEFVGRSSLYVLDKTA
jgi:predicted GNAT family acetyltransferase